jgi:hypothetical protein
LPQKANPGVMRTRVFVVTVMKRKKLLSVELHKDRFNGTTVLVFFQQVLDL